MRTSFNAASISSSGTVPPHIRYTYSAVMQPGSIEHDRASDSRNPLILSTNSVMVILLFTPSLSPLRPEEIGDKLPDCVQYIFYSFHTSSSSNGRYGPSFASNSTVPLSRHFKLCHCPFSIFSTIPPGTISIVSVRLPCSS